MFTYTTRDGRVLKWSGLGACVCTRCDELFNSVAAFDHHLRARDGKPPHHHEDMPRNKAGRIVISLREQDAA